MSTNSASNTPLIFKIMTLVSTALPDVHIFRNKLLTCVKTINTMHLMANKRQIPQVLRDFVIERDKETCQYCGYPWVCNALVSNKLFKTFQAKKKYIRHARTNWLKYRKIQLWLEAEVKKLGKNMRDHIIKTSIILRTVDEMNDVARRLSQEGCDVVTKPV